MQKTARDIALVGGKGTSPGEMARAAFPILPGFFVTTDAYHAYIHSIARNIYVELENRDPADPNSIRTAGSAVCDMMAQQELPAAVSKAIVAEWQLSDPELAYAVHSSVTAEDLPTASFAGQQYTYLTVIGQAALQQQVRKCFISPFTDRAILCRI